MRYLAVLSTCFLLAGCSVQIVPTKAERDCELVYSKAEWFKQVCKQGNVYKVKSIYIGTPLQYIAEQIRLSPANGETLNDGNTFYTYGDLQNMGVTSAPAKWRDDAAPMGQDAAEKDPASFDEAGSVETPFMDRPGLEPALPRSLP